MPTNASTGEAPVAKSWLDRVVDVRQGEWTQLAAAFAYFFCVLCAYYIIRPLREDVSARVDRATLTWLFTVVFLVMILAVPAFGFAASRLARRRRRPAARASVAAPHWRSSMAPRSLGTGAGKPTSV